MSVEDLTLAVERLEAQSYADSNTYAPLLRRCGNAKMLALGKRIHIHARNSGHDKDTFVGNLLVEMYGRCTSVDEAREVFDAIKHKNLFSWNILVGAYTQNGHIEDAREIFDSMPERDVVSWNTIFGAYAQTGHLSEARALFENTPFQNVVSWNSLIKAYARRGYIGDGVCLFHTMQLEGFRPNEITFVVVLSAFGFWNDPRLERKTRSLEAVIVDNGFIMDVSVGNALMNLYSRIKNVEKVKAIFDKMVEQDVVSWTTLISAYARNGHPDRALVVLPLMDLEGHSPDGVTLISLSEACAQLGSLNHCLKLQAVVDANFGLGPDTKVGNSLISMYGKCGRVDLSFMAFWKILNKDVISWTALMTVNAQNGHPFQAMEVFKLMDLEGLCVDKVAWISGIDACTSAVALSEGRSIHLSLVSAKVSIDIEVYNALLNMYAKCGSLIDAVEIVGEISRLDVVGWNAAITAFAQNGHYSQAIEFFRLMMLEGSSPPDSITFISVLNACSHKGLLKDAISHFASMIQDHGIHPVIDHYVCMVDLLGRVGESKNAEDLLGNMPLVPNEVGWRTLLGACGINGDVRRGKLAAKNIDHKER